VRGKGKRNRTQRRVHKEKRKKSERKKEEHTSTIYATKWAEKRNISSVEKSGPESIYVMRKRNKKKGTSNTPQ